MLASVIHRRSCEEATNEVQLGNRRKLLARASCMLQSSWMGPTICSRSPGTSRLTEQLQTSALPQLLQQASGQPGEALLLHLAPEQVADSAWQLDMPLAPTVLQLHHVLLNKTCPLGRQEAASYPLKRHAHAS